MDFESIASAIAPPGPRVRLLTHPNGSSETRDSVGGADAEPLRYHIVHDLVGAGADALEAGVAPGAAHRRLLHVPVAAVDLEARVDEAVLHLGAVLLRHRDLRDGILAVQDPPHRRVEERASGFELGGRVS